MTDVKIPSHRIRFDDDEIDAILAETQEMLGYGQVILGDYTRQFEKRYAKACSRQHGVAVSSDTAAFEMQLKTIDVLDQYVLFPALAFPSILESVKNAGGEPWFIDARLYGHLFADAEMVEDAILKCQEATGQPPAALILMHTGGLIARWSQEIEEVCADYGVFVLEDAAHAFGAELDGNPAGNYGISSAFSLYATKPMHTCEGGMIVTNDGDLADECRVYRNYGRVAEFGRSVVTVHGYSWRITEFQAIVGLERLKRVPNEIKVRREIMADYDAALWEHSVWDQCPPLPLSEGMQPNGYRYIRMLPETMGAHDRARMKQYLKDERGIDLPGEVYELPAHRQPVWTGQYGHLSMPVAEEFCRRHFALPVYPSLTSNEQEYVIESVTHVLRRLFAGTL